MEQISRSIVSRRQSRQVLIHSAAIILFIYALVEVSDCLTAVMMALDIIDNPYPIMLFEEVQSMFDTQPIWLVPLFLFFTTLRITSAIGLWRNKMWGFWTAIFVSAATLQTAPFLFPFTAIEMLGNGILVILLIMGYFGDTPISQD